MPTAAWASGRADGTLRLLGPLALGTGRIFIARLCRGIG